MNSSHPNCYARARYFAFWGTQRAVVALACALPVWGCFESKNGPAPNEVATNVVTFGIKADIPKCNPANFAHVYYVTSETQFYYCDGKRLQPIEVSGEPGADGTPWLVSLAEATPEFCENGGVLIQVGPDNDRNGALDSREVAATQALCNGVDGDPGPQGEPGAPGADGQDGANGQPAMIAIAPALADACPGGGVAVSSGFDENGNGVLDPAEVQQTQHVCNGSDGSDGEDGTDGAALVRQSVEPAGPNCAHGGVRIDAGLDADGDGELSAAEIDNTTYVCNDSPPDAECGNGQVQPGEQCDDTNVVDGDGCSSSCELETLSAAAFRITDLDLRDPHIFAQVPFLGCTDATNLTLLGMNGINPLLQQRIQTDGGGDGVLDFSMTQVFDSLVQTAGGSTPSSVVFPNCSAPMSSTECTLPAGSPHHSGTAINSGASCLERIPGTVNTNYTPALVEVTAPAGGTCYAAELGSLTFDLAGIPLLLDNVSIGGEYFGNPATEIRDGLIRGFLREEVAAATIIPEGLTGVDSVDGEPLSELLRGGNGSCSQPAPALGDRDTFTSPAGAPTSGWYFYLNFSAARVPYTEL